jgi:hypothetical protein
MSGADDVTVVKPTEYAVMCNTSDKEVLVAFQHNGKYLAYSLCAEDAKRFAVGIEHALLMLVELSTDLEKLN